MNVKFQLEAVELKVQESEHNPEFNVTLKGLTYEVTDMSLTEYIQLWKMLITEGGNMIKEFGRMQEEIAQAKFEREQKERQLRISEIRARVSECQN